MKQVDVSSEKQKPSIARRGVTMLCQSPQATKLAPGNPIIPEMIYHGLLWVRYLARSASQPRPHTSKAWAAVYGGLGIPNAGYVHPV